MVEGGLGIVRSADPVAVRSRGTADPPEVEAQRWPARVGAHLGGPHDHRIVHVAAVQGWGWHTTTPPWRPWGTASAPPGSTPSAVRRRDCPLGYHGRHENSGPGSSRPTDVSDLLLARRRLGAYLDGALDAGGHPAAVVHHLDGCSRCRREVDGLRRMAILLRGPMPAVAEPDWTGFWPGIVRGIQDAPSPGSRPAPSLEPPWVLGGAAVAVGGLLLSSPSHTSD